MIRLGSPLSRSLEPTGSAGMPFDADSGPCTNCGAGPVARFCAACGQRQVTPEDFTAKLFLRELLSEFVSLDGRFWLTLWTLVRHPGKLARDYFDGRGARYMRPLNLFLLLNLVFFVIQPHTGMLQWHLKGYLQSTAIAPRLVEEARRSRAEEAERDREKRGAAPAPPAIESMDVFESNFEATLQNLKKSMLLLAIPLFAIALTTVYGTRHRIAEHLIFSTHFYAFAVFALTLLVPAAFVVARSSLRVIHAPTSAFAALNTETALSVALVVLFGVYLYVGVRRMYGDSRFAGAIRASLLSVSYQLIVVAFALSAFRVTLWVM